MGTLVGPFTLKSMKNQYFADQNDFFKYDLLLFLAEQLAGIERLSVIWMLTGDDNSQDGGKTHYQRGTGEVGLYHFLNNALAEGTRCSRPHFSSVKCPRSISESM